MDKPPPKSKMGPGPAQYRQEGLGSGTATLPRATLGLNLSPQSWAQRYAVGAPLPPESFLNLVGTHPLEWVLGALLDGAKDLKNVAQAQWGNGLSAQTQCLKHVGIQGAKNAPSGVQKFDLGSCQSVEVLEEEGLETYDHVVEFWMPGLKPTPIHQLLEKVPFNWGQMAPWATTTYHVYSAMGLSIKPKGAAPRGTLSALGSPQRPFEFQIDAGGTFRLHGDVVYHLDNAHSSLWVRVSYNNFHYGALSSPLGAHLGYTAESPLFGSYTLEANSEEVTLRGKGVPCVLEAERSGSQSWEVDICQ